MAAKVPAWQPKSQCMCPCAALHAARVRDETVVHVFGPEHALELVSDLPSAHTTPDTTGWQMDAKTLPPLRVSDTAALQLLLRVGQVARVQFFSAVAPNPVVRFFRVAADDDV